MRRLTLVRHAKSDWDDPALPDHERPLNARGQRDAPAMGRRLAAECQRPPLLVASSARRAWATACCFAEALSLSEADIRREPRIYEATPGSLLALVNAFDDANPHVLMFGHNPGFSDLARLLAPVPFNEMPTAAICDLEFDAARWSDIGPGDGRLLRYLYPKDDRR